MERASDAARRADSSGRNATATQCLTHFASSWSFTRKTDLTSGSLDFGGLEFAHFMGGADFRISRVFGVGPFIDLSLGKFSKVSNDTNFSSTSGDAQHATHAWIMLGARFVFLP